MKCLAISDFAQLFGTNAKSFSASCRKLIESMNFKYRVIYGEELEKLILRILVAIDQDKQIIGDHKRRDVWNKGWLENLEEYKNSHYNDQKLIPKFIRNNNPVRLNQNYIQPSNPKFELDFIQVYRQWFLETYFDEFDNIYEFGCGTGFNLVAASEIYPNKYLFGSDFVQSSVDLVNEIARSKKINLEGSLFDMINPNYEYQIRSNSGIFTFGALEQLASNTNNMLDYLIAQQPGICLHTEPAIELYEQDNLSDYLAIKFQGKRGYTKGLLPQLYTLESKGKIKIIKIKRLFFGSLLMEGYNLIIWKPIK